MITETFILKITFITAFCHLKCENLDKYGNKTENQ